MMKGILRNLLTGEEIEVHATTYSVDSPYGFECWFDTRGTSYGQVQFGAPFGFQLLRIWEEDDPCPCGCDGEEGNCIYTKSSPYEKQTETMTQQEAYCKMLKKVVEILLDKDSNGINIWFAEYEEAEFENREYRQLEKAKLLIGKRLQKELMLIQANI